MLITRAVPGIDILIEVFLCHRVDKVSAKIFFYAYNTATYLYVTIRILRVND
jgi:hypothetical protein